MLTHGACTDVFYSLSSPASQSDGIYCQSIKINKTNSHVLCHKIRQNLTIRFCSKMFVISHFLSDNFLDYKNLFFIF